MVSRLIFSLFSVSCLVCVCAFCASVEFQFRHNVCGRSIYAEGTADALVFLAQVRQADT